MLAIFHNLAGCDASERNFTGEPENGALGMYYPEPYGLFKKKSKGEKFGSFFLLMITGIWDVGPLAQLGI